MPDLQWYIWLVVAIVGILVIPLAFYFLAMLLGYGLMVFTYAVIMWATVTSVPAAVLKDFYWPRKNRKWLRHGLVLNCLKVATSPVGFSVSFLGFLIGLPAIWIMKKTQC